ncbi:polysaccharide lyase 8 family protein [Nonomuraea sp. NPDC059007]|uniref:polysaccharide lyase 8 family protein n=1 Tax=Nonomuraea sp. NPDC059007 TaxID=3346692 RepID=UPI0036C2751C
MLSRRAMLLLGAAALLPAEDPFELVRRRWRELATGPVVHDIDGYVRRAYAPGTDPEGNWWRWQIGVPKRLLDSAMRTGYRGTLLLEAVDHFVPESVLDDYDGTSTGANRVDLCTVLLLRAVLGGDHSDRERAARAVAGLAPVLRYVTEGDGFYRDGSFIQHSWVPYQGGYGAVLLSGLARLFAVLRGTPWEVADRQIVHDSVERSFAPFIHQGMCMDLVRGRSVGRHPDGARRRAREIAEAVLLLGETAGAAERARWRGMVKGWGLLDDDRVAARSEPTGHVLMPMSARAVHRAPGWCAALSMSSHRIGHYEHGNGENLRGWHTGAGMLYWWTPEHPAQYADGFWQSVDPYRLPGTTVSTRRLPDGAGTAWGETLTPWRWVGGATDGTYATVGHHLSGLESSLEAFKSWFFLDDAVVCLGAGIACSDGVPVETVVDNRRTGADLAVDRRAGWFHLDGHAGYVVLDGAQPKIGRDERYVTLWLDHGTDPADAGYAYALLPGASEAGTRARAAASTWLHVLANASGQQAVHVPGLGLTAANFWQPGTAGPLTASAPCAVLVREKGDGTATLTVADPRRELPGLTVVWNRHVLVFESLPEPRTVTLPV